MRQKEAVRFRRELVNRGRCNVAVASRSACCTLGDGVVTRFTEYLVSEYLVLAEPAVLVFLVFAFVLFES